MEAQEIFNKVYRHLLAQGVPAKLPRASKDICAYRGADGSSCSVGCLIPDQMYDRAIEGVTLNEILDCEPGTLAGGEFRLHLTLDRLGLLPHAGLLIDLQDIHDDVSPEDWEDALESVAKLHNLEIPQ